MLKSLNLTQKNAFYSLPLRILLMEIALFPNPDCFYVSGEN